MNKPSSQYLSVAFPCFKGVTLPELFRLVGLSFVTSVTLSLVIGIVLGHVFVITMVLGFFLGIFFSWLSPSLVAKRKEGKPHGYLIKQLSIWMSEKKLIKEPFLSVTGAWSKTRTNVLSRGDKHV